MSEEKKRCEVCGYLDAEKFMVGDVVVYLCSLHIAEYRYWPDGFLKRHGINYGREVE